MNNKVVYLPLDERPCNYEFAYRIFKDTELDIIRPKPEDLGDKKKPAEFEKIKQFLLKETKNAYGLVISIDMLVYGGIVPSRLHYFSDQTIIERLRVIESIKEANPKIKIFAFNLIMRCPQYSSSDEEPDYYEICGREIFLKGYLDHKKEINIISEDEVNQLQQLQIEKEYLEDYVNRRKTNRYLNIKVLEYVSNGMIDFLIIPQDDSSEYGYTAKDQVFIRKYIEQYKLMLKVYMYPGADEVGNTLMSRMLMDYINKRPIVYILYPSIASGAQIPCLEDRYLDTTVKYQIIAAGGIVGTSISESDIVLFVSASGDKMIPDPKNQGSSRGVSTLRNMQEIIEKIDYLISINKPVAIADVTYLNGGDFELLALLESKQLTMKIASYAGWNTSSNTLGTAIPHGFTFLQYGNTEAHRNFLASRYLEDIGYCSLVRGSLTKSINQYGFNYFDVKDQRGIVAKEVKKALNDFKELYLKSISQYIIIEDIYMPWRRMFEVGINIKMVD